MSNKLYELKQGDDIREFAATLTSDQEPESALLIIRAGDIRIERELTQESDGDWKYRFTDDDFTALAGKSIYQGEIYATFSDGSNGTYPTRGQITIKIYPRL